jgi:anti-sigma regulatory factor (Ser/Thr protein kinase)
MPPTGLPESPLRVHDHRDPIRDLASMRFQPGRSASAPRLAREALGEWLARIPCSDTVTRDAQLVVSELTTNTIVHTRSAPTVVVSFDDGRLRIEVHDQDRAPPRIGDQSDPDGGWGLRLVDAVTDGWGWNPTKSGKHVWIEMLC